jgi:endo-1,4-beta-xylanase
MRNINLVSLVAISLFVSACGGGGGGSSNTPPVTTSSATVLSSSSSSLSVASSSSSSLSSSSAAATSTSSTASSASPQIITVDMTSGWRGNGTGNSGISYSNNGVSFTASAADIGAVFDVAKPTQLENAVVTMVVNVSSEFKASGADLQIFAQVKGTWAGEWDCWSSNSEVTAGVDSTLNCTISEADNRFNQSANDVQIGIQAKGTPTGVVTIKSTKITLAQSASSSSASSTPAYSANVDHLKDLASFPIGIAVSNTDSPSYNILTNTKEQALAEKHFSQMTAGNIMKVSYMHPSQDTFYFTDADAFVAYAKSKNIKIHAHTLIWHSDYQVPAFMKNWTGSASDFLTMLDTHVNTLVDHFKASNNIASWDVVNEALTDSSPSNFRTDSPFYIKSGNSAVYIERAFKAARLADANVDLFYNDYNIEQNGAKMTKLVEMLTDFQARSIPITGVGFQMHITMDYPSVSTISAAMKKVADKGLKVKISELDIAINNPYSSGWPGNKVSIFTNDIAMNQKKRYCEVIKAYMDTVPVNLRAGITVWGSVDKSSWLNTKDYLTWPLLFDDNYNDKPALRGFADGLLGTACTNL